MSLKRKKIRRRRKIVPQLDSLLGFTLPSDDSDDASYEPDDEIPRKKIAINKETNRTGGEKENGTDVAGLMSLSWSVLVPNEILQRIFDHAVTSVGSVPLLPRCSRVCRKWHLVASWPPLWRHIDLSYMRDSPKTKDDLMRHLCDKGIFSNVNNLNLSWCTKITSLSLSDISLRSTELTTLILNGCGRVTAPGLLSIATNCQNLTAADLSNIPTDATSNVALKHFLQLRGQKLTRLYLAGNKTVGNPTLTAIQNYCGKLTVLDLSDTSVRNLCPETLQNCCPNMVELRLAQLSLTLSTRDPGEKPRGAFKDLELLSLASISGGMYSDNNLLFSLAKSSCKLRQLDMRGREKLVHFTLQALPAKDLEQLFLSRCKMAWTKLFEDINCKWKHSLAHLDISWVTSLDDTALMSLVGSKKQNSVLSTLNLAGSGITAIGVREILAGCPNLSHLDLTSCRGVPRGMKQAHDKQGVEKLRRKLQPDGRRIKLDK